VVREESVLLPTAARHPGLDALDLMTGY